MVDDLHRDRARARSFGAVAAEYAEHRPGYAPSAVEWALRPALGGPPPRLLDLGAGTGKLTAALLGFGRVVAVEPDDGMRAELVARHPDADARAGTAEDIPVPDSSVDAVLVGQAWHWFDHDRALVETARVLRSGGALAVLWNNEDTGVEWVRGYLEVIDGLRGSRPTAGRPSDIAITSGHPGFANSATTSRPNPVRTTADGLVATIATHSWVLVRPPQERERALQRLRAYFAGRPETSAGEFELPLVTEVLRVLRK